MQYPPPRSQKSYRLFVFIIDHSYSSISISTSSFSLHLSLDNYKIPLPLLSASNYVSLPSNLHTDARLILKKYKYDRVFPERRILQWPPIAHRLSPSFSPCCAKSSMICSPVKPYSQFTCLLSHFTMISLLKTTCPSMNASAP